jgi:hypothetical protein
MISSGSVYRLRAQRVESRLTHHTDPRWTMTTGLEHGDPAIYRRRVRARTPSQNVLQTQQNLFSRHHGPVAGK